MRRTPYCLIIVAFAVSLAACSSSSAAETIADMSDTASQPTESAAQGDVGSVLMEVVTPAPAPGQQVSLVFSQPVERGGYYVLEQLENKEWVTAHYMQSDDGGREPVVSEANIYGAEYAVGGVGPDNVILPDLMDSGEWRICTYQPLVEEICASFWVG